MIFRFLLFLFNIYYCVLVGFLSFFISPITFLLKREPVISFLWNFCFEFYGCFIYYSFFIESLFLSYKITLQEVLLPNLSASLYRFNYALFRYLSFFVYYRLYLVYLRLDQFQTHSFFCWDYILNSPLSEVKRSGGWIFGNLFYRKNKKRWGREKLLYKRLVSRRKWYFVNRLWLLDYESKSLYSSFDRKAVEWWGSLYSFLSYGPIYFTWLFELCILRLFISSITLVCDEILTNFHFLLALRYEPQRSLSRVFINKIVNTVYISGITGANNFVGLVVNFLKINQDKVLNSYDFLTNLVCELRAFGRSKLQCVKRCIQTGSPLLFKQLCKLKKDITFCVAQKRTRLTRLIFHCWILEDLFEKLWGNPSAIFFALCYLSFYLGTYLFGELTFIIQQWLHRWIIKTQIGVRKLLDYFVTSSLSLLKLGLYLWGLLRVGPKLIFVLEVCEFLSVGLWFVGRVVWPVVTNISLIISHVVFYLLNLTLTSVVTVLKRWLGMRRLSYIRWRWLAYVEYHDDVVEEAFTKFPPKKHPYHGPTAWRVLVLHRFDRRTRRWYPSTPYGKKYKPQGRGLRSTRRLVRIMRLMKLILFRGVLMYKINAHRRWWAFFTFVIFINVLPAACLVVWKYKEDGMEEGILLRRAWWRYEVVQRIINISCNLEQNFLNSTYYAMTDEPLLTKIESRKNVAYLWYTKLINLVSCGRRWTSQFKSLLRNFETVLDQVQLVLPFLQKTSGRNAGRLLLLQRVWKTDEKIFLAQVDKFNLIYRKSYPAERGLGRNHSWTGRVNNYANVHASWLKSTDLQTNHVDTDLMYWLASLEGYTSTDTNLINAALDVFRLQDVLLADVNEVVQGVDAAVDDVALLTQIECDLMNTEDSLLRLKKSLNLLEDALLGLDSFSILNVREKRRLITIRDQFLQIGSLLQGRMLTARREAERLVGLQRRLKTNTSRQTLQVLGDVIATLDESLQLLDDLTVRVVSSSTVPRLSDWQQWEQDIEELLEFKDHLAFFKLYLRETVKTTFNVTSKLLQLSSSPEITELMREAARWQQLRRDVRFRVQELVSQTNRLLEAPECGTDTRAQLATKTYELEVVINRCVNVAQTLTKLSAGWVSGEESLMLMRKDIYAVRTTASEIKDVLPPLLAFSAFVVGVPLLYCVWILPFWVCCTYLIVSAPVWYCLLQIKFTVSKFERNQQKLGNREDTEFKNEWYTGGTRLIGRYPYFSLPNEKRLRDGTLVDWNWAEDAPNPVKVKKKKQHWD